VLDGGSRCNNALQAGRQTGRKVGAPRRCPHPLWRRTVAPPEPSFCRGGTLNLFCSSVLFCSSAGGTLATDEFAVELAPCVHHPGVGKGPNVLVPHQATFASFTTSWSC
jgi:hypothetical protein